MPVASKLVKCRLLEWNHSATHPGVQGLLLPSPDVSNFPLTMLSDAVTICPNFICIHTCSGVSSWVHLGHCADTRTLRQSMLFPVAQNPVTCFDIHICRFKGTCLIAPPIASQSIVSNFVPMHDFDRQYSCADCEKQCLYNL
jgi:hypothetical protein